MGNDGHRMKLLVSESFKERLLSSSVQVRYTSLRIDISHYFFLSKMADVSLSTGSSHSIFITGTSRLFGMVSYCICEICNNKSITKELSSFTLSSYLLTFFSFNSSYRDIIMLVKLAMKVNRNMSSRCSSI